MPKLAAVSWRKFILRLRALGFIGPHQEGKHPYMVRGSVTLTVPNQHDDDISVDLLVRLLRQAGVSRTEWLRIRRK